MAEWLRRLTRNQFPSGSAGSNPADCEIFSFDFPTIVTPFPGAGLNFPFNHRAAGGRKKFGDGGYRSPYLSHAKRALYHLSYVPFSASEQQISLGHPSCVKVKLQVALPANQSYPCVVLSVTHITFDSSVGRAVDCSCTLSDIHRSLVQIRLEGFLNNLCQLWARHLLFAISIRVGFINWPG